MNKLAKFITRPYIDLIFSLLCGLSYFFVALKFITSFTANGSMLLAFFFCPAIICGMAFVILKSLRQWAEQERYTHITLLVILHLILFLIGILFLIDVIR